ncbi:hypothetical protein [Sutterella sp.]|uniref:tetratricopeptide repeat protein n=1 Tax=Sutterella sp. TaxID=1981025 RepID=UPI0026E0804D|nr:hypothetical protein [Sutterella sp.]MDO5532814.1 hypothetical protein [Sutterella sp.]
MNPGFAALLLALLLAAPASGPALSAPAAEPPVTRAEARVFAEAQSLYREGRHRDAMARLDGYLKAPRPHPFVLTLWGLCALAENEPGKAAEVLTRGVSLWPRNHTLRHNQAVALQRSGDFPAAGEAYLAAADLVTRPADRRLMLVSAAGAFHEARAWRRIRPTLGDLAGPESSDADALKLAGAADIELGDWERAETTFVRLAGLLPADRSVWQTLASIRIERKRPAEAAPALETAAALARLDCGKDENCGRARRLTRASADLYASLRAPRLGLHALSGLDAADFLRTDEKDAKDEKGAGTEARGERRRLERRLAAELEAGRREAAVGTVLEIEKLPVDVTTGMNLAPLRATLLYELGRPREALAVWTGDAQRGGPTAERSRWHAGIVAWELGDRVTAKEMLAGITEDEGLVSEAKAALKVLEEMDRLEASLILTDEVPRESYREPVKLTP